MCADGGAIAFERDILMGIARVGAYGIPVYGSPCLPESADSDNKFSGATALYGVIQQKCGEVGNVTGIEPPIKGFPGVAAALKSDAVRVIDGV